MSANPSDRQPVRLPELLGDLTDRLPQAACAIDHEVISTRGRTH
jgi:hypothetical protein